MRRTIYLHDDAVPIWTNTRKIETGGGSIGTGCCVQWEKMVLSRIYAAPITRLGCLAFEGQGALAPQS
jgi:hypothetical protein